MRWQWGLLCLAWIVASCSGRPTPPPASAQDVLAALEVAGASVAETAIMPFLRVKTPGRVWQVNESLIQLYEFESVAAREAVSQGFSPDGRTLDGEPLPWVGLPHVWALGRVIVAYDGTDGGTILLLSGLLGDPLTSGTAEAAGPYPPAVTAAIDALAAALNVDPGTILVLTYEPAEWPDACLGVPSSGEACAQVTTPGWRVTLQAAGETHPVHTDDLGLAVRFP